MHMNCDGDGNAGENDSARDLADLPPSPKSTFAGAVRRRRPEETENTSAGSGIGTHLPNLILQHISCLFRKSAFIH